MSFRPFRATLAAMEMTEEQRKAYDKARKIILDAARRTARGKLVTSLGTLLVDKGLVVLPPEIGQIRALTRLSLVGNQLTTLPPEIGWLTALTELRLSRNKLTTLPPEIGQLTALTELSIYNNRLTALPPEIGRLTALTRLSLVGNQLTALPPEIGQLTALKGLGLVGNRLTALPPEIGQLTALAVLNFSGNPLTGLPPELRNLKSLEHLYLHDTPLARNLPENVLGPRWEEVRDKKAAPANPADILDYYFSLHRGARTLDEARVLVVGRGNAGKTSLCRALQAHGFDPRESQTTGVEIQIGALKVRAETDGHGRERSITLHLWDFAGQEITYALHRFFLSRGVIYLLALENRDDRAMDDAEEWLRTISAYGGDAPVVLAATKQGRGRWELDEEDLRGRWRAQFPRMAFVATDAEQCLGIEELKRTLTRTAVEMPETREAFPLEYDAAKWRFESMKAHGEKRLALEDFCRECLALGIGDERDAEGKVVRTARERAEGLARMLHRLGVVLHYAEDRRLRESTVLDPQWVTNGVYRLLRALEAEGEPRLTLARARQLLPGEDRDGVLFLLRLMERFEMVYAVDVPEGELITDEEADARTVWLMPAVLPVNQPKLPEHSAWRWPDPAELRLRFTYTVLPEGLLPRFIVRTWPLNDEMQRWRGGTFLREGRAEALVRAVKRNRMVEIAVRGQDADRTRLARLICRHMEAIHRDVPEQPRGEIEVSRVVGENPEVWKNIEVLEKDEARDEKGESTVETSEGTRAVKASQVLESVSGRRKRKWETGTIEINEHPEEEFGRTAYRKFANRAGHWDSHWDPDFGCDPVQPARVFVSYSHRDKRVCDVLMQNLSVMEQDGLINAWTDNLIPAGEQWDEEIKKRLAKADLFIGLVTTAFLGSNYIRDVEFPTALERREKHGLKLALIIVEQECGWKDRDFSKFQVILPGGRAVRQWGRMQDAFNAAEKTLRQMVEAISGARR